MSGTPSSTRERIGLGCVGQITSYPVPVPLPDVHLHERQSTARYCCLPLSERHAVTPYATIQRQHCLLFRFIPHLLVQFLLSFRQRLLHRFGGLRIEVQFLKQAHQWGARLPARRIACCLRFVRVLVCSHLSFAPKVAVYLVPPARRTHWLDWGCLVRPMYRNSCAVAWQYGQLCREGMFN